MHVNHHRELQEMKQKQSNEDLLQHDLADTALVGKPWSGELQWNQWIWSCTQWAGQRFTFSPSR
jgi:hypothetical protein